MLVFPTDESPSITILNVRSSELDFISETAARYFGLFSIRIVDRKAKYVFKKIRGRSKYPI